MTTTFPTLRTTTLPRELSPLHGREQPAAAPLSPPATLLIGDHETERARALERHLEECGFSCILAHDAAAVEQVARLHSPDAIALSVDLPPLGALPLCYRLRNEIQTALLPILLLREPGAEGDKSAALEVGADDVFLTPDEDRYIAARLRALIRRARLLRQPSRRIEVGDLVLDPATRQVLCDGRDTRLSSTEYRILQFLASSPGQVHSRAQIAAATGNPNGEILDRTIDAHIKSIRRKLGPTAQYIQTVRGFGYRICQVSVRSTD